ncbi:MAG: site-specific integrase [Candidatus Marinimicrobia bacterium]|jgi:integrase/recombinase XerD|nr:site-specific integrase [Candidatus Neomarinimicrobiota bacterium]MBT4132723.1 site-specific integrase [Candidatus Neomarinimicrobiota bacterium]MBT4295151.1 site-specific integrase [Candidatus Neomarinimicrobiota bacterium]MBT4420876.1 site-specific integrase [Candidatus Neomarinimicrobiota bacterium]MBT4992760.1 site-specific integrase [Candidatus Neomarinimicrobiota bacterium]
MTKITSIKTSRGSGYKIDYYDTNGTRRRIKVYTDRKTAERMAAEIEFKKTRIKSGLETRAVENILLSEAINYTKEHSQNKPKTIEREQIVLNAFLFFLGGTRVRHITTRDLTNYFDYRLKDCKLSPQTVGLEFRTLRAFFNVLITHQFIEKHPMRGLNPPPKPPITIRFLTVAEIKELLKVIKEAGDQDYLDLVQVYLHTGTRREEILADRFTWGNVDFEGKRLKIVGKKDRVRFVPMDELVFEILIRRSKDKQLRVPFPLTYSYTLKKVKKYYDKANILNANIHTFRRTFGSLLVQKGVSIFTVSKLLGHSSVTVTETHYAHLVDANLRDGVEVLGSIL